jgi:glycosyltransferase involved in cell wall biosynthesis
MATPPLTIGLPVYNGERYLPEALDSILGQSCGDFELLISDNGSTDATESICREAAARDGRIRYHRSDDNRGGSWNFGFVATNARGPLFRFAAHDDVLAPTLVERCLAEVEARPDAVLWYPRTVEIDAEGRVVREFEDSLELLDDQPHQRLRRFLDQYRTSNALFGVVRRDALLRTRIIDDFHSSDIVFLGELSLLGRFVEVPEPLFRRRWDARTTGPGSSTAEIDRWYNPNTTRRHQFTRTRLLRELTRSILRAPLPPAQRGRAVRELYAAWVPRYGRTMLGECKRGAIAALPRPARGRIARGRVGRP